LSSKRLTRIRLAMTAFQQVLGRKQSNYRGLIEWLKSESRKKIL
jgi:hypothetical protein